MGTEFKSGFVAVLGRPNAGKSTLVNRLVGQKVAIVTSKPQTTRNRIQGIVNRPDAQVILIDTPGHHRPNSALGRQMMGELEAALDGVDALALLLDVSEEFGKGDREVLERGGRFQGSRILLLNKIDRVEKSSLLPRIEKVGKMGEFAESNRLIRIRCTVYVERDGQKGILIGRRGETLKQIGTAARKELEQILGTKIFLELFVKVRREWRDSPTIVRELDWRSQLDRLSRK